MAEMIIAAEQTRSMAIIAAVHVDVDDVSQHRRAISGAKAYVGQAARFVGQQAVQLHGAMGMVDDLIVSHYFRAKPTGPSPRNTARSSICSKRYSPLSEVISVERRSLGLLRPFASQWRLSS
jgi:alkylation response protein AidB-like acyl-CoA dehydrogenase